MRLFSEPFLRPSAKLVFPSRPALIPLYGIPASAGQFPPSRTRPTCAGEGAHTKETHPTITSNLYVSVHYSSSFGNESPLPRGMPHCARVMLLAGSAEAQYPIAVQYTASTALGWIFSTAPVQREWKSRKKYNHRMSTPGRSPIGHTGALQASRTSASPSCAFPYAFYVVGLNRMRTIYPP